VDVVVEAVAVQFLGRVVEVAGAIFGCAFIILSLCRLAFAATCTPTIRLPLLSSDLNGCIFVIVKQLGTPQLKDHLMASEASKM
jgi:hypothetical protein